MGTKQKFICALQKYRFPITDRVYYILYTYTIYTTALSLEIIQKQ